MTKKYCLRVFATCEWLLPWQEIRLNWRRGVTGLWYPGTWLVGRGTYVGLKEVPIVFGFLPEFFQGQTQLSCRFSIDLLMFLLCWTKIGGGDSHSAKGNECLQWDIIISHCGRKPGFNLSSVKISGKCVDIGNFACCFMFLWFGLLLHRHGL